MKTGTGSTACRKSVPRVCGDGPEQFRLADTWTVGSLLRRLPPVGVPRVCGDGPLAERGAFA